MSGNQKLKSISKFLSYVLRHHPEEIGLEVDEYGWAEIDELIEKAEKENRKINRELIEKVVESGRKKRFIISENRKYIRAGYGHSIGIKLDIEPSVPPENLYHGTARKNFSSILESGIQPQSRNFVHLSSTVAEAKNVGGRHGKPIVLKIEALKMHEKGESFYQSESETDIWLVTSVPPEFIVERKQDDK